MRISANRWIGYEPLFIAEANHYFDSGAVHLIETPFSLTLEQSLRGGTIDAAALSISRAFTLVADGFDVSIVLVLDWSNGADKILAAPGIDTVADLAGRRVGSEARTVNTYLLLRALQKFGVEPADVTIVPVANEKINAAYAAGTIDAASAFGPEAGQLEQKGARNIFDSSSLPGEIMDVLVVRTAYLKQNPRRVEQMISGWFQAVDYLENLQEGELRPLGLLSASEFEEAVDDIKFAGLEENRSFFEADAVRLSAILRARRDFLTSAGGVSGPVQLPPITPEPLLRVIGERDR